MDEQFTAATSALRLAVEQLYSVFAGYALDHRSRACAHCVEAGVIPADAEDALHAKPLRALDITALTPYVKEATLGWGSVDDLRHFLPRLLELLAQGHLELPHHDIASTLARIGWRWWNAAEREAIEAFVRAWWAWTIAAAPPRARDDVLQSIGALIGEVASFLNFWREEIALRPTPALVSGLLTFLWSACCWLEWRPDKSFSPFWRDHDRGRSQQLLDWLCDPRTLASLETAGSALSEQDGAVAGWLQHGVSRLRWAARRTSDASLVTLEAVRLEPNGVVVVRDVRFHQTYVVVPAQNVRCSLVEFERLIALVHATQRVIADTATATIDYRRVAAGEAVSGGMRDVVLRSDGYLWPRLAGQGWGPLVAAALRGDWLPRGSVFHDPPLRPLVPRHYPRPPAPPFAPEMALLSDEGAWLADVRARLWRLNGDDDTALAWGGSLGLASHKLGEPGIVERPWYAALQAGATFRLLFADGRGARCRLSHNGLGHTSCDIGGLGAPPI